MGDELRGSLEKLRWRRRHVPVILLCASLLCGLPGLMLLVYEMKDFQNRPLALWTLLLFFPMLFIGIPCFAKLLEYRSFCREYDVRGFDYWLLYAKSIALRFGVDPPRTLPLAEIRSIRLNKRKSQIFLETNGEPMVITCRIRSKRKAMPFLPFLNNLIERLEPFDIDTSPLHDLQDELRKSVITKDTEPMAEWIDACSIAGLPLLIMLAIVIIDALFLRNGEVSPVSRLWIMLGLSALFFVTIPIGLRFGKIVRLRRNRRIDEKYHAMVVHCEGRFLDLAGLPAHVPHFLESS